MFRRLRDILGLARSLFSLRAELGLVLTRKSLALTLAGVAAAFWASVGLLVLLAAAVVALAPVVGYALALTIVGSATVAAAVILWSVARQHHRSSEPDDQPQSSERTLRARISEEEDRLQIALGGEPESRSNSIRSSRNGSPSTGRPSANGSTARSMGRLGQGRAVQSNGMNGHAHHDDGSANGEDRALVTPKNVLAAGFATAALLGPSRLVRSVRLMTFLGSAASVVGGLRRDR